MTPTSVDVDEPTSPPTPVLSPAFVIAEKDRAPKLAAFPSGTVACAARPVAANASVPAIASASATRTFLRAENCAKRVIGASLWQLAGNGASRSLMVRVYTK